MAPPLTAHRYRSPADSHPDVTGPAARARSPFAPWHGGAVLLALLALHLTNPHSWGQASPALWFPAAGVGLCLVAWFGRRAVVLVLVSGLLVTPPASFLHFLYP